MTNADGERGTGFRLSFRELGLGCGGRLGIGVGGQVRFERLRGSFIHDVNRTFKRFWTPNLLLLLGRIYRYMQLYY